MMFNARFNVFLMVLCASLAASTTADQIIINGDGREILLKDDGSWQWASDNIYLDTKDGRRVVLTPDGQWQYVGLAPVVQEDTYRELLVEVAVSDALISQVREKVGGKKNTRTTSTMQFNLTVSVADSAQQPLDVSQLDKHFFAVSDNRGKTYSVENVSADTHKIAPGQDAKITLQVDGAPGGLIKPKLLLIGIAQQAFATEDPIQLELEYDLIQQERVNL